MICIEIDRDAQRMVAKGHAGSHQPGKDIVCAGVTTLLRTLAECGAEGTLDVGAADLTLLGACPVKFGMFAAVELGLQMLAEDFPEYVQVHIVGEYTPGRARFAV